ncbi:hypothetical protein [Halovivax asiaticus]|uniref:hypothetical protein n=1 Tax=Halovivax asiaticus TaxID=332953 RepID=UPI0013756EF1|nr:hypothetical protein [Halovivax asiaticus]
MIGPISIVLWAIVAISTGVVGWTVDVEISQLPAAARGRSPDEWLWFDERTALGGGA